MRRRQIDASFAWDDLKALRDAWPHTLLVKGVMDAEDAARCMELATDGVVLSNHGGRQLEDDRAPIEVLPEVAARVQAPLLLENGVRRDADAVKALALGARVVLLGRVVLYGLAARGEEGASQVLHILMAELDTILAWVGCSETARLGPGHVADVLRDRPDPERPLQEMPA